MEYQIVPRLRREALDSSHPARCPASFHERSLLWRLIRVLVHKAQRQCLKASK